MLRTLTSTIMAGTVALGALASAPDSAEARRGRGVALGIAAGIIGLGIAGAIADDRRHYRRHNRHYSRGGGCYPGPEECGWSNRRCFENSWGDVVCRGGRWTCWQPTYCD